MEDHSGHRFGRYQVTGQLGRGGMAVVYRAVDPQLNREVAIKVVSTARSTFSQEAVERFQRELKAMALVNHSNIVRIFDSGTDENQPYLVTELIEGKTLDQVVRKEGKQSVALVQRLTRELLEALVAVHDAGLVHRDIKPSNLMVTEEGRLVLMDFGIALAAFGDSLTKTGDVPGTLAYLPPECLGGKKATVPSDLFQVGLVAYELLVGKPLFTLQNPRDFLMSHGNLPPKDLKAKREDVPDVLEAVVRKSLEPEPADRFQTAPEMLQALQTPSGGPSRRVRITQQRKAAGTSGVLPAAKTLSTQQRAATTVRMRGWGPVATGVLTAAVLLAGGIWVAFRPGGGVPEPPAAFDLRVNADALEAVWNSDRRYRGAVELDLGEPGLLVAEEPNECRLHRVRVPGSFEGLALSVRAGVAGGAFGPAKKTGQRPSATR